MRFDSISDDYRWICATSIRSQVYSHPDKYNKMGKLRALLGACVWSSTWHYIVIAWLSNNPEPAPRDGP